VRSGKQYYLWVDGRYDGEWDEGGVSANVYTKLAAAADAGKVKLHFIDKEGNARDKPFPQIMREYGRTAKNVIYSMFEEHPRFDETTQTFHNSICERDMTLTPAYDAEVDEWLNLLGQDKADLLKDWLAASVVLDRPISALHISAPTNSGKNLIVNGLARLWGNNYQNLRDYSALMLKDSPIVYCDEGLPPHWRWQFSTLLRAMTSQSNHTARDTGFSTLKIHGYLRLIFAGNDALMNLQQENLSGESIEATMKRIVSITHKNRDAKQYLEDPTRAGKLTGWVNGVLARHVLWLNENRAIDTKKRFMVEDTDTASLTESLTSKSSDRIFRWIFNSLATSNFHSEALLAKGGKDRQLYLHLPALETNWSTGMSERERPTPIEFQNAANEIANFRTKISIGTATSQKDRLKNVRRVNLEAFARWMKENQLDLDVDDAIDTLAKIRSVR
jgi:hypothetical protein